MIHYSKVTLKTIGWKIEVNPDNESFNRIYSQVGTCKPIKLPDLNLRSPPSKRELGMQEQKSDYQVLMAARTGAGKSTIIKSCSSFPDNVNFPVINANRTTTFPTEYVLTNSETYDFKIVFQEQDWIIQRVQESISAFIQKYASLKFLKQQSDNEDILIEAVNAFNDADEQNIFLVRLVLSRYKKEEKTSLDVELNAFWKAIYTVVEDWVHSLVSLDTMNDVATYDFLLELVDQNLDSKPSEKNQHPLDPDGQLIKMIVSYIYKRTHDILTEAEEVRNNQSIIGGTPGFGIITKADKIKGYHGVYSFNEAWNMLRYFFSRDSSDNGKAVTALIKRAKVKIPYNKEFRDIYPTISLHDIIGYGHTNGDTGSLEGSTSINYSEYDAIAVIERSDDPMNDVTKKILKNLLDTALKKKILICYSHYHKLNKDDWSEDSYEQEREHELKKLQEQALRRINIDSQDIKELSSERTLFLRYDVHELGSSEKPEKSKTEFLLRILSPK